MRIRQTWRILGRRLGDTTEKAGEVEDRRKKRRSEE
jgi:hypothetical protein